MLEHLSTPIPNAQSKNIACAASCAGELLLSVARSDAAVLRDGEECRRACAYSSGVNGRTMLGWQVDLYRQKRPINENGLIETFSNCSSL